MVVDAAVYLPDFTLTNVNATKATALVTLPAVITVTGADVVQRLLAEVIERQFSSYEELVSSSEALLTAFREIAVAHLDGDACSTLSMIGWSTLQNAPCAHSIYLWTDGPARDEWLRNSALLPGFDPSAVQAEFEDVSANITGSPMPDVSKLSDICFEVRAPDDYTPQVDLLHILEAARRTPIDGKLGVGGAAVLSSIDASGITQRVIHRWDEDRVGEKITPQPIDWKTWRAAREPRAEVIEFSGLSRLQRERMQKKAAKRDRLNGR